MIHVRWLGRCKFEVKEQDASPGPDWEAMSLEDYERRRKSDWVEHPKQTHFNVLTPVPERRRVHMLVSSAVAGGLVVAIGALIAWAAAR